MDTVIHLNVDSLTDAFVRDLKEQIGPAQIELRVQKRPKDWLTVAQFWDVIALLDWSKTGDDDAVVEPLVKALAAMPVGNIYQFEEIMAEKLFLLDTRDHARASLKEEGEDAYLSADGFLYDRCAVVANGKKFYEAVLNDPSKFPAGLSFEALLSVAHDAHERKTGQAFQPMPKCSYETGSNIAGWPDNEG